MKITCESCKTRFLLDDARIPPQGAKVRCSRCQHRFHVKPPPSPLTPDEIASKVVEDNAPEGVDIPPPSEGPPSGEPQPVPPQAPVAVSQPPGPPRTSAAKAPPGRPRREGGGEAEAALDNPEFLFDEPTPPQPPPPPDPDFDPPLIPAAPGATSLPPKKRAEPAAPVAAPSQEEPSQEEPSPGPEDEPLSDEPDDLGEDDDDPALGGPEPLPDGRDALFGDGSSYLSDVPEEEQPLDEEASAAPSGLDLGPPGSPFESASEALGDGADWSDLDIDPGALPPRPPPMPRPVAAARSEARPAGASTAPAQGVEALEQPARGRISTISIRLVALSASLLLLAGTTRAWWVLGGGIPRGPAVVAGAGWEASGVEAFHVRGDDGRTLVIHGSLSSTTASGAPEVTAQLLDVDGMPVGAPVRGSLLGDRSTPLAFEDLRARAGVVPPGIRGVRGFAVVIPEPPPAAARYRLTLSR